jgi:hypothetical protein
MSVCRSISLLILTCSLWLTSCQKEAPARDFEYRTLGTSSHDFLSSSSYTALIVQISYMPGYKPNEDAINSLKLFLETYLHKPAGIQVKLEPVSSAGQDPLTLEDIAAFEKKKRIFFTYGNIITAHVLITDSYFTSSKTLALSYWNTSTCIFGRKISDYARGNEQKKSNLFKALLQHEFGHLLGLVDQGSPMQSPHKDASHGAHCSNPSCLMFYGIETSGGTQSDNTTSTLDADCIADLKANGGK